MSADERFPALSASARRSEARDPESTFRFGVRALIRGLLEVTDEMTDVTPNEGNETHERSVDTTADTAPGP